MKMSDLPEGIHKHLMGGPRSNILIRRVIQETIEITPEGKKSKGKKQDKTDPALPVADENAFVQHWKDGEKTDYVMVAPFIELDSYPEPQNNPQEKK